MKLRFKKVISKLLLVSLLTSQLGDNIILAHTNSEMTETSDIAIEQVIATEDFESNVVETDAVNTEEVINENAITEQVVDEETYSDKETYIDEIETGIEVSNDETLSNEEIGRESLLEEAGEEIVLEGHSSKYFESGIDESVLIMPMASKKDINWVNNIGAYPVANGGQTQLINEWEDSKESISPLTGELSLNVTDLELPGRNGFDLKLGRIFRAADTLPGQKKYSYNQISFEEGNYSHDAYELGLGWSFTFPSVEIKGNAVYYHTGEGETYLVNTGSTYSNLENYTQKDIKFTSGSYTTSLNQKAKYCLQTISGEKQYFNDQGLLLEMVDRFKNTITFKHKYYLKGDTYDDDYVEVSATDKRAKRALIYQITDSVKRDVIFKYNTGGSLNIKVFEPRATDNDDPSKNTSRKAGYTIDYQRKNKVLFS